jgi:glucose-6-phosphate isomerase, archaeal
MVNFPFTYVLPTPDLIPSRIDNQISRRLSSLSGQFLDQEAYQAMLAKADTPLYDVYEIRVPEAAGELLQGISFIHPGKVGNEFFMTKGHFHSVIETAEVYLCMGGEGFMVMETPEGESVVEALSPGKVLYVPPRWAHRAVCTSRQQDLVIFFVYPGNAGHDYGTIEQDGFRKLVVEVDGEIKIIDNPRWKK